MRAVALALVVFAAGCATRQAPTTRIEFASPVARQLACLDLRDHVVVLYADDYVAVNHYTDLSPEGRAEFRRMWGEELAKQGVFERFEDACFGSLQPSEYACGMRATTPEALGACMNHGRRD